MEAEKHYLQRHCLRYGIPVGMPEITNHKGYPMLEQFSLIPVTRTVVTRREHPDVSLFFTKKGDLVFLFSPELDVYKRQCASRSRPVPTSSTAPARPA